MSWPLTQDSRAWCYLAVRPTCISVFWSRPKSQNCRWGFECRSVDISRCVSTGSFVPNFPFIVHFERHALKHFQVEMKKDSTIAWLISHQNQSFQTSLHVGPVWNPGAVAPKWHLSSQVKPLSVCMAAGGGSLFWSSVQCWEACVLV